MHHRVLEMVRDRRVMWRETEPARKDKPTMLRRSAGFALAAGGWLEVEQLVALYELRRNHLITVDGAVVLLSADGRARLAEWDTTRAVNR